VFTPLLRGTEIELGTIWTVALNRNQNLLGKTMLILNRPSESVAEVDPHEWRSIHYSRPSAPPCSPGSPA